MENLNLNIGAIDLEKSESGVWIEYDSGISFLIARADTSPYRSAVRKMHKRYKRQIEQETLSDEKSDRLMAELMAEHILLGWSGMMNGKEEFKYSRDNAVAFLSDERYAEVRQWIMAQSQDLENFRAEEVKKPK
ncbi:MAG: hypothetical protein OEQ39_00085 [Gammaproteobacteria bacterium]|nr:hypothetical protein [Gammaproteobacteria bacterium]